MSASFKETPSAAVAGVSGIARDTSATRASNCLRWLDIATAYLLECRAVALAVASNQHPTRAAARLNDPLGNSFFRMSTVFPLPFTPSLNYVGGVFLLAFVGVPFAVSRCCCRRFMPVVAFQFHE